jgi:hypothetical protein
MGLRLATDVYVDGERYPAGAAQADLAKVSTDVDGGEGKKPVQVSVADRITNPLAWVDDDEHGVSTSEFDPKV